MSCTLSKRQLRWLLTLKAFSRSGSYFWGSIFSSSSSPSSSSSSLFPEDDVSSWTEAASCVGLYKFWWIDTLLNNATACGSKGNLPPVWEGPVWTGRWDCGTRSIDCLPLPACPRRSFRPLLTFHPSLRTFSYSQDHSNPLIPDSWHAAQVSGTKKLGIHYLMRSRPAASFSISPSLLMLRMKDRPRENQPPAQPPLPPKRSQIIGCFVSSRKKSKSCETVLFPEMRRINWQDNRKKLGDPEIWFTFCVGEAGRGSEGWTWQLLRPRLPTRYFELHVLAGGKLTFPRDDKMPWRIYPARKINARRRESREVDWTDGEQSRVAGCFSRDMREGGQDGRGQEEKRPFQEREKRGEKIKMNRAIIEAPRNQEGSRRPCLRYLN